ncbi:MAG: serine hydrolase [Tidjanibacter sp.]|nr:serine hydrolase [Tidjanibacter sp.]
MKKNITIVVLVGFALLTACNSTSQQLPRSSAEVTAAFAPCGDRVFRDVESIGCNELHSLMVVRNDTVVYERWGRSHSPEELHIAWSMSKTFTAMAVGFAAQDGLLTVDDKVIDFFPNELPQEPSEWLKAMTINNLLTMSSGFSKDYLSRARCGDDFDWAAETLALPVVFCPGTRFAYNSMNTYLLSVIVSRVTGQKLSDYLNERLFKQIGIDNYMWDESPQGYTAGGWGLFLTTESFAKAGLFVLHRGNHNGRQILNAEWIDAMTSPQILQSAGTNPPPEELEAAKDDDWAQGYGYQMWCSHNGARFDGAFGQFILIMPEKSAVTVITAHQTQTAKCLQSVWTNIYDNL